jgi:hypothetical protein
MAPTDGRTKRTKIALIPQVVVHPAIMAGHDAPPE